MKKIIKEFEPYLSLYSFLFGGGLLAAMAGLYSPITDTLGVLFTLVISLGIGLFIGVCLKILYDKKVCFEDIYNQEYSSCTIKIDGKNFYNCHFRNVTIRWDGEPFNLHDCKIESPYRFETKNNSFVNLISLMKYLKLLEENFANSWKHMKLDD